MFKISYHAYKNDESANSEDKLIVFNNFSAE
jgi:hypothetical protein